MTVVFIFDGFLELREAYEGALQNDGFWAMTNFWEGQPGAWIFACALTVVVLEESKHFAWPLWSLMKGEKVFSDASEESDEEEEEVVEEESEEVSYNLEDCSVDPNEEDCWIEWEMVCMEGDDDFCV